MFENLGDMQKFAKANMDASMRSFDLLAKNFQTIATEMTLGSTSEKISRKLDAPCAIAASSSPAVSCGVPGGGTLINCASFGLFGGPAESSTAHSRKVMGSRPKSRCPARGSARSKSRTPPRTSAA